MRNARDLVVSPLPEAPTGGVLEMPERSDDPFGILARA